MISNLTTTIEPWQDPDLVSCYMLHIHGTAATGHAYTVTAIPKVDGEPLKQWKFAHYRQARLEYLELSVALNRRRAGVLV